MGGFLRLGEQKRSFHEVLSWDKRAPAILRSGGRELLAEGLVNAKVLTGVSSVGFRTTVTSCGGRGDVGWGTGYRYGQGLNHIRSCKPW